MTNIYINNTFSRTTSINGISNILYYGTGQKVYSAKAIEEIYGVFISNIIEAPEQFLRWDELVLDTESTENMWLYIKTSSNDLKTAKWIGPYKNLTNVIDDLQGKLMQIMVIMRTDLVEVPKLNKINVNFISSQNVQYFFSKTFDLGFRAKHILLTYNANVSEDSVLRFAVTGENTSDLSKYQFIEPNKIEKLTEFPTYADKIKLMMEVAGDSGVPLVVNEIAMIFSGDESRPINEEIITNSSSSSDSETSASEVSESDVTSSSSIEEGIGFDAIEIDFMVD